MKRGPAPCDESARHNERQEWHSQVAMRRVAFVVFIAACGLLLVQAPASARCVVLPFDTAVRQAQVVWWGTVTGTQHEPPTSDFSGGWTLAVRLQDVLKGPGSVGETRLAIPARCTAMAPFSQKDAQQYVGQALLFMGHFEGDVLVPFVQVFKPQNRSPEQQYQRALKDLGLQRPVGSHPAESTAWSWWVIVPVLLVLGLGVLCVVSLKRRWPVVVSVAAWFATAFLLFMPIGCVGGAASGAASVRTTCQNVVGLSLPGFSGKGPGFSPSYWTPLAAGSVAAAIAFVVDRTRRRRRATT